MGLWHAEVLVARFALELVKQGVLDVLVEHLGDQMRLPVVEAAEPLVIQGLAAKAVKG
jgi:hypothetical protein